MTQFQIAVWGAHCLPAVAGALACRFASGRNLLSAFRAEIED